MTNSRKLFIISIAISLFFFSYFVVFVVADERAHSYVLNKENCLHVDQNSLNKFYCDCTSIKKGDSKEKVQTSMKAYLLADFSGFDVDIVESKEEHLGRVVYYPSKQYSADFCFVYFNKANKVTRIEVSPD